MSFKGAVKLAVQVDKGPRHRIGLFVMAGGDDVIVLGTNALKKLGWSLAPNAQSLRGRVEVTSGRKRQHRGAKAEEAAVRQHRSKASKIVTVAERLCLKPGSLCCDDMKQDGVLRSSGEILPDTEGQRAQHQTQVPVTNSFAGAKMFREGEVVSMCEGTEMAGRVVWKARAPESTNTICGRRTVVSHPRRESVVLLAELSRGAEAVSLQTPEAKRSPRKAHLSLPKVSENSKEKAPAATRVPQPRVARAQRKRVIKREPVGRSTLAKESTWLQLSKVDGDEVDYVKTAMGDVCAEFTSYLSALKRRLEGRHYVEVVGKNKATKSRGKEGGPGRNERRMRTPVVTARISSSFEAASKEPKKRRRQNKAATARRRRGEYRPSLSVMPDQERPRREITELEKLRTFSQDIPDRAEFAKAHNPPALPPHLLQVILNKDTPVQCDPNVLPEPNHVMLNHLYALSIKDGVMVLSATHRYGCVI
ncbi:unnamed protein product [Heligmosomoides polygyrus]|uniref:AMPKBI domain-containing protein n=1 Tax=Heligmosomoides polygyrus TaxID=6339 RepID=A0A183GND7_HELPZ|nr:unnamed protein product [Heligmosomoides polygyrus]